MYNKKDLKKFCKLLCVPAYTYGESFGDIMKNKKEISEAFKKYLLTNDEEFYEKMVEFGYNDAPGYIEEDNDDKAFTEALGCAGCDNYYGDLDIEIMLHFVDFLLVNKEIKNQFVNDIQESINELNGNIEDIYELFKTHLELINTFNEFKKFNMKDYRNLLNITPQKPAEKKNILEVWMKWDSNDADYIEKTVEMSPSVLFGNKKLIYCLAYITLPYNFKEHDWNDSAFCHHVTNNHDIEGLDDVIEDGGFMAYTDWGACHSCYGLDITYYDENGNPFNVEFEDIYKRWKGMTYEEICKEINEIEDKEE